MRKLYGTSGSSALRSIWAMEEVGVEYEQIATNFSADSKAADYLAINPNGRIPALIDGDLVRRPAARTQGVHDSHHSTAGPTRPRTGTGGQGQWILPARRCEL